MKTGKSSAFTIIELLIVMTIILVLAGLILATAGYVQKKGARSRAEAEIAAMSAALENYKADNGVYPSNPQTNLVDARSSSISTYPAASLFLYTQLSGNTADRHPMPNAKTYFSFKPNMLLPRDQNLPVTEVIDPFGNSYGYSTINNRDANPTGSGTIGYNPTFDLWSTGGVTNFGTPPNQAQWIKNW